MKRRLSYTSYTLLLLLTIILMVSGFGLYVRVNDPYWLWSAEPPWHRQWGGHNRVLDIRHRFAKAIQVVTRRPEVIVIGSSRVYRGIDTEAPDTWHAYNLGISSLRIREARAYVRHAIRWTPAKTIVFGLDYFMFNALRPSEPGFDEDLGDHRFVFRAIPISLFTRMAYKDVQRARQGVHGGDGYWTYSGFKITNPRSQADVERLLESFYTDKITITPQEYAAFADILDEVRLADVQLIVYVSPMNTRQVQKMKDEGEYAAFMAWKKRIGTIAREHGLDLYDFSLNNPFYDDQIAAGSSPSWIDTTHYSPVVGAWILRSIGI